MSQDVVPDNLDPFQRALDFVLRWEGGKVDDPDDRGGRTAYGVTQKTYTEWGGTGDVWDISRNDVETIYRVRYWNAVNGDGLASVSPRMAVCVFDAGVQSGPVTAAKQFQRAIAMQVDSIDGRIGKVTLSIYRLRKMDKSNVVILEDFMDLRRRFYAGIVHANPTQRKFANGWRNRRNALRALVGLEPEE